jgi:hypothetical protein
MSTFAGDIDMGINCALRVETSWQKRKVCKMKPRIRVLNLKLYHMHGIWM